MSINGKSPIGYLLEVDPEKFAVSNNILSKYCKSIADKYEIKVGDAKKHNFNFR